MPAFSLLIRPRPALAVASLVTGCSPTTPPRGEVRGFGKRLKAREFSAQHHLTSELLRTL